RNSGHRHGTERSDYCRGHQSYRPNRDFGRRIFAGGRGRQAGLDRRRQVMRNISAWAIKHPVTPIVLFVVLFFLGTVAFIRLPINLNPDVSFPAVDISINQPGAAPQEMETQIAQKVEGAIASIGNIHHQQTRISEGSVFIIVEFNIGTPIDRAVTDVRDAIARVRADLPQGILEPQVQREEADSGSFAIYAVTTTNMTPEQLSWSIDN